LSDPDSYDFPNSAQVNTNSMTYASIASIFVLLFGGILYDLLGRKATVTIMLLVGAISCGPMPFGLNLELPVVYFTTFKVVYNCSFIPLIMNPFINDYVIVQDRGVAMGLQNLGLICGTLLSVGGLYTLTSKFAPKFQFPFLSLLQLVWIAIILATGMISEPKLTDKELKKASKKSLCGKVFSALKQTWSAC